MNGIGFDVVGELVRGSTMTRWPSEARLTMGMIRGGPASPGDGRALPRTPYFLQTDLLLTGQNEMHLTVFTRDVSAWNVGFIAPVPLAKKSRAIIRLTAPDGRGVAVACRIRRCQGIDLGWFDCSAEFFHPQFPFENLQ